MVIDDGNEFSECNERYYVPCEITWLLKSLGYKKIEILSKSAFSRDDGLNRGYKCL